MTHAARRAQRYPLELPVRFRAVSDSEWHTGSTTNLSNSGVIIRSRTPVMPATRVEVVITFPANTHGSCLIGEGRVVRSFSLLTGDRQSAFAVTFTRARLQRC